MARTDGHIQEIDWLRAVAALAVLANHVHGQFWPNDEPIAFFEWFGTLGVSLFFVISGFCIRFPVAKQLALSADSGFDWRGYSVQRLFRIAPPYWTAIAASVLAGAFFHTGLLDGDRRVWSLALHVVGLHTLTPSTFYSVNAVFWTIGVEVQFYALYIVFAPSRTSWSVWVAIFLAGMAVFGISSTVFHVGSLLRPVGQYSAIALLWQWYLGALIADRVAARGRLTPIAWTWPIRIALLVLSLALGLANPVIAGMHVLGTVLLPMTCGLIVWSFTLPAEGSIGWLAFLGRASYSLYLFHPIAIGIASVAGLSKVVSSAFAIALALAFAVVGYLVVERPAMRLRRNMTMKFRVATAVA